MKAVEQLDRRVASAFYGAFTTMRECQEKAIEPLLQGRNVVLAAGTGSGKTEAVTAPIVSRFWREAVQTELLTILYVAPTKALINDLEKRLSPILVRLGLRVGIRHGERDDLTSGRKPHVLITTPESLDVLLFRKDAALATIKAVVIDEVHLLYNTQRGLQLSILLRRLKQKSTSSLQWAAVSATIGRLTDIRDFLVEDTEDTEFISCSMERHLDAQVRHVASKVSFLDLVRKLVTGSPTKLLVFTNSRRECERLANILAEDAKLSRSVFTHYSSLSTEVRLEAERNFAASASAICLATSTLELGIDIGDIDAVLLWGVPPGIESFLQRIGRGNRRSSKTNVVCLIPDDSSNIVGDALRFMALVNAAKAGELPVRAPYELFGSVAQQCLGIIASERGSFTRVAELCETVCNKRHLNRQHLDSILAELAAKDYLKHHGFKNQYGGSERLYQLVDYRMIYGNFAAGSQTVNVFHESTHLGTVPATNLLRIRFNVVVRFAGKCWRTKKASPDGIFLKPVHTSSEAIDFTYGTRVSHTDSFVLDKVWHLLHSTDFPSGMLAKSIRGHIANVRDNFRKNCSIGQIPYTRSSEGIRYLTYGGYFVNKAIALVTTQASFRADDVSLQVATPISWTDVSDDPKDYIAIMNYLFEQTSEQSIYQALLPLDLQLHEFTQQWLKDETIRRVLERLSRGNPILVSQTIE